MSERFLADVLREAPRPRRRQPWWWRPGIGLLSALCVVFGLVSAYDGLRFTAAGWVVGGLAIWAVFKEVGE